MSLHFVTCSTEKEVYPLLFIVSAWPHSYVICQIKMLSLKEEASFDFLALAHSSANDFPKDPDCPLQ